ncbi:hypothetical protein [Bdellovibrio bacteriovorus]|uniref:hypothetical protein n=1 Tax=Bdellovibrio bacteriovorus TaxID=959 RepID=UPI000A8ECE8E|nr:hypothetical protein [Bdellovibrio bacteriovorus]
MELGEKFLNLLFIFIPLIFFVSLFFYMESRRKSKEAEISSGDDSAKNQKRP